LRRLSARPPRKAAANSRAALRAEVLAEEVRATLPGVGSRRRVVGRAVVRVEAVTRARVDDDLDVRVVLLHEITEASGILRLWILVCLAVEPEQRDVDVLGEVESRHGSRGALIGP